MVNRQVKSYYDDDDARAETGHRYRSSEKS